MPPTPPAPAPEGAAAAAGPSPCLRLRVETVLVTEGDPCWRAFAKSAPRWRRCASTTRRPRRATSTRSGARGTCSRAWACSSSLASTRSASARGRRPTTSSAPTATSTRSARSPRTRCRSCARWAGASRSSPDYPYQVVAADAPWYAHVGDDEQARLVQPRARHRGRRPAREPAAGAARPAPVDAGLRARSSADAAGRPLVRAAGRREPLRHRPARAAAHPDARCSVSCTRATRRGAACASRPRAPARSASSTPPSPKRRSPARAGGWPGRAPPRCRIAGGRWPAAPAAAPRARRAARHAAPVPAGGPRWLQHLRAHGAGGVLADDMGLGKTLQTIAHLVTEKEAGRLDRPGADRRADQRGRQLAARARAVRAARCACSCSRRRPALRSGARAGTLRRRRSRPIRCSCATRRCWRRDASHC